MRPYPGPRSVLLLDNCAIHHGDEVHELIEAKAGAVFVSCCFLVLICFRRVLVVFTTLLPQLQSD